MIQFDDVTIGYGTEPVLDRVSFTIDDGDLCLLVGATGSGKSTLLGAINGLVPHFTGASMAGDVRVDGRSTRQHPPREFADLVGFVGQNPLAGFVTDTVEDEIAYGMEQLGVEATAMRKRVEETLDLMNIADLRRRALVTLSGGQQQRVAIAAVLAAQPRVLVLDEPTSALDPTAAQDVLAAITSLVHDLGLTVVLAEHRLERVMQAADQVLWLPGDGSAVLGAASEVLGRASVVPPLAELAATLGWDEVPLSVRQARRKVAAERIVLRPAAEAVPTTPAGPTPLLRATGLTVRHGDLTAVDGINLDLHAGSVTTLMGRNGAGKSSLFWALQGAQPSTGSLQVDGHDPRRLSPARARELVGLVPQTAADLLHLHTVALECQQSDRESGEPVGTTEGLLRRLGADLVPDRHPRDLSEGQRLALVLAIQLAASPRIVLLDEPTRGLDYPMKQQLADILADLASRGHGVVVSTHDVEFAAHASQRTVILAEGDVIADGPTREVCTASPAFAPQVAKVFHPEQVLTTAEVASRRG
ncbi:ABC transporter ATP-binding protein [Aestuariimicrobium ganziense]|uniref:ABC transporter ATP-binding protein n=1 Tax=Aestuariimicrobium ganziense TaxID=2773677 RepID=UPI001945229C|nr:ABC transporter ATP-binding protein [Aestuariimicrobium ganziense]